MARHRSISGVCWLSALVMLVIAPPIVCAQEEDRFESGDRQRPATDRTERRAPREDRSDAAGRGSAPAPYWLGLECEQLPDNVRAQIDAPEDRGLLVIKVVPKSPAAAAGLIPHDVLLSADGKPLARVGDLVRVLEETKDKPLTIELLRKGKTESVNVTPTPRPERLAGEQNETPWNVIERLQRASQPPHIRRLTPGMALSPAGPLKPPFPVDLGVTITKRGKAPASVEVKKGDQSWTVNEDELDKLPANVRAPVQGLLGQFPFSGPARFSVQFSETGDSAATPAGHQEQSDRRSPNAGNSDGARPPRREDIDRAAQINPRLERQLRQMSRQLRELREDLEELRRERAAARPDRDMPRDEDDEDDD